MIYKVKIANPIITVKLKPVRLTIVDFELAEVGLAVAAEAAAEAEAIGTIVDPAIELLPLVTAAVEAAIGALEEVVTTAATNGSILVPFPSNPPEVVYVALVQV